MAAVLAQMRGDAVGARRDRNQRRAHRIGIAARPCITKGGDVIDIDSKTQRSSFRLAESRYKVEGKRDNRFSCGGSTRASIFLKRMDCRVKPGNDALFYPLTRSTRATTALARNWAIIALRCLRS